MTLANIQLSLSFVKALLQEGHQKGKPDLFNERRTQIAHVVGDTVYVVGDDNIHTMKNLSPSDLKIVEDYLTGLAPDLNTNAETAKDQ